jgi:mono/diheme cytochrome c family protein
VRRTGGALLTALLIAAGAASAATAGEVGTGSAAAETGKALYIEHCAHCHGVGMVTPGTVAFDLRGFPHDQKERFVTSVMEGKNARMPPWGDMLGTEQIDALWAYVLTGGKP